MSYHRAPKRVRAGVVGALVLAGLVAIGGGYSVVSTALTSSQSADTESVKAAVTPSDPVESFTSTSQEPTLSFSPDPSATGTPSLAATTSAPATPSPTPSKAASPKPSPSKTRGTAASTGTGTGTAEQQVLNQINAARADAGVGPLTMSRGLVASAHAHNLVMADGCGLSHQCDGEDGLGDRISAQGVDWGQVAENIGDGGPVDDTEAAQARMAVQLTAGMLAETPPDDGHRKNILNGSLNHIGIDVIRDSDGTVWLTQDFSD